MTCVSLTYNMEQIYKPNNFNGTDHINFKEYFKEYSSLVLNFQKVTESGINNDIFATMDCDFDNEEKKMLVDACSINHLTVEGEKEPENSKLIRLFQPFEITQDAEKLETVKQFKKRQEERRKDFICDPRLPEIDMKVVRLTKYLVSYLSLKEAGCANTVFEAVPKVAEDIDLTPGRDYVVYVRLFRPFEYTYGEINTETLKFDQEIALLGTNTLADFRDKIGCTADLTDCTDRSDDIKNLESFELTVTPYPSGFIFIDDTFYNDFRQSDSLDYSEVIRQWAKGKGIGPFKTAEMKDIQIQDLTPRMSYPYVYQHHGRCEHIFIFSHARLLNSDDMLHSCAYPFYSNACLYKNVNCMICGLIPAAWLVTDYDRLSRDEAPLCKHCLLTYCYVNGKKIGKFGVYPYMNRTTTIL